MDSASRPVLDVEERIDSSGCGKLYRLLEECIASADRDWRRCQEEVAAFRECMRSRSGSNSKVSDS